MALRELGRRTGILIRDGWGILGITLVLLLSVELAYRASGEARRWLPQSEGAEGSRSPLDSLSRVLAVQEDSAASLVWRPYVYFRRAGVRTSGIEVASTGLRVTPQSSLPAAADTVYMFGGSTMWGSFQRDSFTLAALTARALADSGTPMYVKNYGETGYVQNQELITLLRELQAGGRPRVVVFYDGINDIVALAQAQTPGVSQNESNRAREFVVGRKLFHWEGDVRSDIGALAVASQSLVRRSHIVQRLLQLTRPHSGAVVPDSALINSYLDFYTTNVRIVEAIGMEYGFCSVFVWQPTLHSTRKQMSAREASLFAEVQRTPFGERLINLHQRFLTEAPLRAEGVRAMRSFVDLSTAFDEVDAEIFVDVIGHTNERANDYLSPHLARAVSACSREGASGEAR